jgi:hypothetical protein
LANKEIEALTAELKTVLDREAESYFRHLAKIGELAAENEQLREALRPFAAHVGKQGAPVVLHIGEDTWSGTLTAAHFWEAYECVNMHNEDYQKYKAYAGLEKQP